MTYRENGGDSRNETFMPGAAGVQTSSSSFGFNDHQTIDGGGYVSISTVYTTNDGHGNTSSINETDVVTDAVHNKYDDVILGGESTVFLNGTPTSDIENHTDVQGGKYHFATTETQNANDVYTSVFPSGLIATATYKDCKRRCVG